MCNIRLTQAEAAILIDVVTLVLNDPDWQELATATDQEWQALSNAYSKIYGGLRT